MKDAFNNCTPSLLARVSSPSVLRDFTQPEQEALALELRERIIATVSKTGGHLAPSLGVVELTIALLRAFDAQEDKILWDVGHQSYAYKLLTGRAGDFDTLRQYGGLCGFPRREESPYDHFGVGHASTALSAALGMVKARELAGLKHHVVAVVGDGAMTGGMAYEAMNQAGAMGKPLIVVLNDNAMSISKNVGALSFFMSRNMYLPWVRRVKKEMEGFLQSIPGVGDDMLDIARRSKSSFKTFFTRSLAFEALHFKYIGPVKGHDLEALDTALRLAADMDGPVLVHVLTTKGKGYAPAEANPTDYHGVGRFEPETGKALKSAPAAPGTAQVPSYTEVFAQSIIKLAEQDPRIVAITAAMPEGTGLTAFAGRFPERFIDVGICEQHAVTFAAGLAAQGLRPVVAIYSTFLQRSFDQVIHDVCLQNLPVLFCLDRGGLVGEDGPTHHGVFDLSYLRCIPNLKILAPRDEAELRSALRTGLSLDGPVAIRYPRAAGVGVELAGNPPLLTPGMGEVLLEGDCGLAAIAVGSRVYPAMAAAEEFKELTGLCPTIFDARWVKPLPEKQLLELARANKKLLLLEENALAGGFGSAVLEFLSDHDALAGCTVRRLGIADSFVTHGAAKILRHFCSIDTESILKTMRALAS